VPQIHSSYDKKQILRRETPRLGARNPFLFPDLDGTAKEVALGLYEQARE